MSATPNLPGALAWLVRVLHAMDCPDQLARPTEAEYVAALMNAEFELESFQEKNGLAAGTVEGGIDAPDTVPFPTLQDDFSVSVETRLTQEVGRLIASLAQSAGVFQSIREDVPREREFVQLIAGALGMFCLGMADALVQGRNEQILLDDGREYLAELGLNVGELFREVTLDGRRYACIACVDCARKEVFKRADAGDGGGDRGGDVHVQAPVFKPIVPAAAYQMGDAGAQGKPC